MEVRRCDAAKAREIMRAYEDAGLTTKEFYRLMQEWLGSRRLVDKTPSYALHPSILRRAEEDFEGTRYIHLLRHPLGPGTANLAVAPAMDIATCQAALDLGARLAADVVAGRLPGAHGADLAAGSGAGADLAADFPAPDDPTIATNSPRRTSTSTPRRMSTSGT